MNDEDRKAIEEYTKNSTRYRTVTDAMKSIHGFDIFYPTGFGYRVCFHITNETEYLDIIQRCNMIHTHDHGWVPWFVNDWDGQSNEWVEFIKPVDDRDPEWILDGEDDIYAPTNVLESYKIDINQFFEDPIELHKTRASFFDASELRMPDDLKKQLPFILMVCSVDTFDRLGSIQGTSIDIIPLNVVANDKAYVM